MNIESRQDVTVLDLPFFSVQVSDTTLGSEVARIFEANPVLPGIIVMSGQEACGMVARNQFFHRLGRRFGIEVYTPRPITEYLDSLPDPPVVVSGDTIIQQAAIRCLARPPEYVYDPFIVTVKGAAPRLVDFLSLVFKQTDLLTEAQLRLESEMAEAAAYVRSLLPEPLTGPVAIDWCYHPSSLLGGDGFGYHRLAPDALAIYLLDVSGHGVGSALLSSSVLNVLRTHSLAGTDFHEPSAVLEGLNRAFPMAENNDKYFTMWYGIYHESSRALTYASGGHHPAILVSAKAPPMHLRTEGAAIGIMPNLEYPSARITVPAQTDIYLFSDGVYEIARPDETWQSREEFCQFLHENRPGIDAIIQRARDLHGGEEFEDDFSLLKINVA